MLLKKSVCRKTQTHKKIVCSSQPLMKKNVCMLKFSNPHPLPPSRQKNNGPSVISSVPFEDPKNFIYRLGILYMMAKKLVKKSFPFKIM